MEMFKSPYHVKCISIKISYLVPLLHCTSLVINKLLLFIYSRDDLYIEMRLNDTLVSS